MADGHLHGDASAYAIAEEVGIHDTELLERGGSVLRHLLEGQRAVDVGGVSVRLLFEGDYPLGFSKAGQQLAERGTRRRHAAVQKYQWRPTLGAMCLVIHIQAVDGDIARCTLIVCGRSCHEILLLRNYVQRCSASTSPAADDFRKRGAPEHPVIR